MFLTANRAKFVTIEGGFILPFWFGRKAARIVKDENGKPVVQIPLTLWEEVVANAAPELSQKQKIMSLLKKWENEPENDMPEEWWTNFSEFLKANRMNFEERNLGFGDE